MAETRETLVRLIALAAVLAAVAGLLGWTRAFSTLISTLIGLGMALGYSRSIKQVRNVLPIAAIVATLAALFYAAATIHAARGPLEIALGFPLQTTLFVWGVWPLGVLLCFLHGLRFDDTILPDADVQRLLAEHGREDGG